MTMIVPEKRSNEQGIAMMLAMLSVLTLLPKLLLIYKPFGEEIKKHT